MDAFLSMDDTKSSTRVYIVVLIMVLAIGAWWFVSEQNSVQKVQSVTELSSSLDAITAPTAVIVPTTVNPLKTATPVMNPVEKTNPFNNEYQNPFQ